jgi:hypothetical protein
MWVLRGKHATRSDSSKAGMTRTRGLSPGIKLENLSCCASIITLSQYGRAPGVFLHTSCLRYPAHPPPLHAQVSIPHRGFDNLEIKILSYGTSKLSPWWAGRIHNAYSNSGRELLTCATGDARPNNTWPGAHVVLSTLCDFSCSHCDSFSLLPAPGGACKSRRRRRRCTI